MHLPPVWNRVHGKLAIVLLATFILRLPNLFEPPWYDDEGIYAAIGHALLEGESLYRDVLDNRPPGMYWLYAGMLAVSDYSVAFVKLTATAFLLGTQTVLYGIARRLWNADAGLLAAGLLGLLASLFILEGNTANSEIFMMLPTAVGMLLVLRGRAFGAGVAFGLAFLIKQIAVVELAAALLVLLRINPRPRRAAGLIALGVTAPLVASLLYLAAAGTISEFLFAGLGYYAGYVARDARLPIQWLAIRTVLVAAIAGWVLYRSSRASAGSRDVPANAAFPLAALWTAFALYGALFTARAYPHYFLQAAPALSLLIGGLVYGRRGDWLPRLSLLRWAPAFGAAGAAVVLAGAVYLPWPQRLMPWRITGYYENFVAYATGLRSDAAYNDFFDRRVNRNLAVAEFLETHASPDDYLIVWGEEPWLYPLSGLRLGMPYSISYYAYEMPGGLRRVVESLKTNRPTYVVWTINKPLYPELKAELENSYTRLLRLENAEIYVNSRTLVQRRGQPPRALEQ